MLTPRNILVSVGMVTTGPYMGMITRPYIQALYGDDNQALYGDDDNQALYGNDNDNQALYGHICITTTLAWIVTRPYMGMDYNQQVVSKWHTMGYVHEYLMWCRVCVCVCVCVSVCV